MRKYLASICLGSLVLACSSSGDDTDGGPDAANDVTTQKDASSDVAQGTDSSPNDGAPTDSTTKDSSSSDAGDGGNGLYTLTINDYLSWCNVSVNGSQPTSSPTPMQFAPDASVALHGDTASAKLFYWGYWQAPGLADGGKDTNMDVNITMNGDVTILACCPDLNTPLSCP